MEALAADLYQALEAQEAAERLLDFTRFVSPWYQVVPHLKLLAENLELVETGEIPRLMVFMPPRHGKTESVSRHFPAWVLGRHPDWPVIGCSYGAGLAFQNSRRVRNLIRSNAYRRLFPGVEVAQDSAAVEQWHLSIPHRGTYRAAGVGGAITGHGAKLLVIDDPIKSREEAESETYRERLWDWYRNDVYPRLEDKGLIVLMCTRWHQDDLAGRLLEHEPERWEVLSLPAIAQPGDPLGRDPGKALWPDKYPVEDLADIRQTIGSYAWHPLYQQHPQPLGGGMFKREWFQFVDAAPPGLWWVRCWDLATSQKKGADYTASVAVALAGDGRLFVRDPVRGRWSWPEARRVIVEISLQERGYIVGVEKSAFQLAAIQDLRTLPEMVNVVIKEVSPAGRDKVSRALAWQARAESRQVMLVRGPGVGDWLAEVCDFPTGRHDDFVDATSYAVELLGEVHQERRQRAGGSTVMLGARTADSWSVDDQELSVMGVVKTSGQKDKGARPRIFG